MKTRKKEGSVKTRAPKKGERTAKYSEKLAMVICDRISSGESVTQICRDDNMPLARTVYRWLLEKEKESFYKMYTQAQTLRADVIHDEIFDIADDGSNDWMEREVGKGRTITVPDHEYINRSRLRVDTRKWVLARMNPKKYGESIDVTTKGKKMPAARTVVVNYHAPKKPVTK